MKKILSNKTLALHVAGWIFAVVAVIHLLRIMFGFNMLLARQIIPVWASLPACIIATLLALWMFAAAKKR